VTFRGITTLIVVLAAGVGAGCGSDDEPEGAPIPQQAAADIESRLAEVERRMEAGGGACADIQNDTKPAVDSIVASLPSDVDTDVRHALQDSVDRLFDLAEQDCDEQQGQDTQTQAEPPPETDTVTEEVPPPTEEEPPPTEEEPPPTEEEPPPTEEEPPPSEENQGQGNGGGAVSPEGDQ
jgi:outer membrane biosynthesis protein TonB